MDNSRDRAPLPLEGLRVLDATHIVAGPFCSLILADMGAEVIKIERPGTGERYRTSAPFINGQDGQRVSARFLVANRNKKSVTLDLRHPTCQRAFENLVRAADVLLDNWGPGALRRLGLGYDRLRQVNPGLIYASITGYGDGEGLRGPYSHWPANNICVQGMGGWMEVTGSGDGRPESVGESLGDSVPGLWTALAIMLALESRHRTGRGQHVDTAMYECMAAHNLSNLAHYRATGQAPGRDPAMKMINPQLVLKAKDGYVVLAGAGTEEKWATLWRHIGREDLLKNAVFLGKGVTGEIYLNQFVPAIEAWSQDLPMLEVTQKLNEFGFSMGMVQSLADLDRCPHLEARQMFVTTDDTLGGQFRAFRTPVRLTGCVDPPHRTPPALGEHNREVLCGFGGLTEAELVQLQEEGVV